MNNNSQKETLLIVEDISYELESYVHLCQNTNRQVVGVESYEKALRYIKSHRIDILITDLFLHKNRNEQAGIDLIEKTLELQSHVLCIAMSSYPKKDFFISALEKGASYLIKKPIICADEIHIALRLAKEKKTLEHHAHKHDLLVSNAQLETFEDGLCLDSQTQNWVNIAIQNPELPVVICGETGTGKEEIAQLIHRKRVKKEGTLPFQSVNCSTLQDDLATSQLFGHKKGAFSGAFQSTRGYIGEAHGGILFLDEIHHLSLSCQQKLLRVLNDGNYQRLGENKQLYSSFQTIVASTTNLDQAVEEKSFLIDLKMRLVGIQIDLKPLNRRHNDLMSLIKLFFTKQEISISSTELNDIVELCRKITWHGNIRELYQYLKAACAVSKVQKQSIYNCLVLLLKPKEFKVVTYNSAQKVSNY